MSTLKIKGPSGRMILVGKALYKKLRRKGYKHNNDNTALILVAGQQNITQKKIVNPESGRQIVVDSSTYNKLIKRGYKHNADDTALVGNVTPPKKVLNPDSGRLIIVGKPIFKRLVKKYRYDEKTNIFLVPEEKSYWKINETVFSERAKQLVSEARNKHGENKESKYLQMSFYNHIDSLKKVHECLDREFQKENNAFKINIAFGYIRQKDENLSLFNPGRNYFFDEPRIIKNKQDMTCLKNEISAESIEEHLRKQFPDSKSVLIGVYAVAVKITRLDFLIGSQINLPNYIKRSQYIIGLEDVDYNMCFWSCMALAGGCRRDRYKKTANDLFTKFYNNRKSRNAKIYPGFDYVNELDRYEQVFDTDHAINVVSFYDDDPISYIRKSSFNDDRKPIYINLYLNHFSYITDIEKLAKKIRM